MTTLHSSLLLRTQPIRGKYGCCQIRQVLPGHLSRPALIRSQYYSSHRTLVQIGASPLLKGEGVPLGGVRPCLLCGSSSLPGSWPQCLRDIDLRRSFASRQEPVRHLPLQPTQTPGLRPGRSDHFLSVPLAIPAPAPTLGEHRLCLAATTGTHAPKVRYACALDPIQSR